MKIGKIVNTNQKGQLVIPKEYRDKLGINPNVSLNLVVHDQTLYIQPVKEVVPLHDNKTGYEQILNKTQGGWLNDSWDKTKKERDGIENLAAKKRRKLW